MEDAFADVNKKTLASGLRVMSSRASSGSVLDKMTIERPWTRCTRADRSLTAGTDLSLASDSAIVRFVEILLMFLSSGFEFMSDLSDWNCP